MTIIKWNIASADENKICSSARGTLEWAAWVHAAYRNDIKSSDGLIEFSENTIKIKNFNLNISVNDFLKILKMSKE
jgi:hypothetical protein